MGRIAKWKELSEDEFAQLVAESHSFYELAKKIGYSKTSGGTQETLKQVVKDRNLDTSHFTGQGWNKDNFDYSTFTKNSLRKNGAATLRALIKLRERKCECCGLIEWNNQPIPLEVHHIDGNHNNNELDNLQILCLNCHALTDNFRGKKNSGNEKVSEEELVKALNDNCNISKALKTCGLSGGSGNYKRAHELIIKYQLEKFLVEHQNRKLSE